MGYSGRYAFLVSAAACALLIGGYSDRAHASCDTTVTTQQAALGGGTVTLDPNTCVNTSAPTNAALYAQFSGVLEASQVTVTTTGSGIGALAVAGGMITIVGDDPWSIAAGSNGLVAQANSTINASDLTLNTFGGARGSYASGGDASVTVENSTISASGGGIGALADFGGTVTLSGTGVTVDGGFGLYAAGSGSTVQMNAASSVTATAATGAFADGGGIVIDASTVTATAGGTGVISSGSGADVTLQHLSTVSVTGGGIGAIAQNGGRVAVVDDSILSVTGAHGIQASGGATVTVNAGTVSANGTAINAIVATGAGTGVDINNNSIVLISGTGGTGVSLSSGATGEIAFSFVKMNGDVFGIDVAGPSSLTIIASSITGTATGTAVRASFGATVDGRQNEIVGVTNGVVVNQASVTLEETWITTTASGFGLYATGAGASLTLTDGSEVNAGGAFGGYAENGASLTIENSKITASPSAIGLLATGSGTQLTVTDGSTVTTTGTFAPAIRVEQEATGTVADTTVTTSGDGSYGLVADGTGSFLTARNVTVTTHGSQTPFPIFAAGVVAEFGGTVQLEGTSTIRTDGGPNSAGLLGQSDGRPTLLVADATSGPISVETSGADSPAVMGVNGGVRMELTGVTIGTSGDASPGIYMTNTAGAGITGGSIVTTGAGSDGIVLNNGSTATAANLTVTATGAGSNGLRLTGPGINTATLDHVSLSTPQGTSISVEDGTANIAFNNSTATNNSGLWLGVSTGSLASPTVANIIVDSSVVRGAAVTDSLSTSNVSLLAGSHWDMTANSNVTNLVNDASMIAFAAPIGDPTQAASYLTLTVNNYTGANGTIRLNTYLGGDGAPSDRLVVNGGVASGTTSLLIASTGGGAGTYGIGILVVQAIGGGTTADSAFTLGNRVAAGAYDYFLFRGGRDGDPATADNWYLRNEPAPQPGPPAPVVDLTPRPEIATNAVILPLAIQYGYAMLDTLHERIGENQAAPLAPTYEERIVRCKDASKNLRCVVRVPLVAAGGDGSRWAKSGWARLIGNRGLHQPDNYLRRGPNYDYTVGAIQAGLDIWAREQADGTLDKAGLYIGYGRISSDVRGLPGAYYGGKAGTVDTDAYTLGGYWTHVSPSGWYTDTVIQGTRYTDTRAKSVLNETLKPDGFGILGSLEAGYAFKLGGNWTLEPQAQIAYQNVTFDNASDSFGHFRFQDGDSLRGRFGLRLTKTWNAVGAGEPPRLITAWLRGNMWHEFLGKTKTTVTAPDGTNPLATPSYLGGTWGEIGVGVTAQVADAVNLFATGAYQHSLDNKGSQGWDGRLGVTVKW